MLNQYGGGQFNLIKDLEAAGLPKKEEKLKAPRTVADRMIADMYRKVDEAKKLELQKKDPVSMVSIKGIMDEIKALGEQGKDNENKNNE